LTTDGRAFISFGLCYAYAGATDDCGSAAQRFEWCNQQVCNVCLEGENLTDCQANVQKRVCKADFDRATVACQPFTTITTGVCLDNVNVMMTLCGGR
jgi:hypothetical protein